MLSKEQSEHRNSRFFIASNESEVVSFIEIKATGENFTCNDSGTVNICGAYTFPEFRRKGILKSLLSFMFEKLKKITLDVE